MCFVVVVVVIVVVVVLLLVQIIIQINEIIQLAGSLVDHYLECNLLILASMRATELIMSFGIMTPSEDIQYHVWPCSFLCLQITKANIKP